ncbi:hypothetical protein [Streptomyces griseoviridis]|uniref:Translation initiation factor IF-2 n=1 Tax=Streptomyces griseoviridis TaxID=45398 RepID=A0ABT9LEG4_STRGD|nr:hypothetical protein [Streptomyces griseoviridis]MDP9682106.1 hypothetical protein [Streptomyces griseoviridis]
MPRPTATSGAIAGTAATDRFTKVPGRPAATPATAAPATAATDVLPATPAASVRDPWREPGGADGQEHDPHEVTVQLDAVQLGDGALLRKAAGGTLSADPADRPVFVDESGRRIRLYRRIGIAVGLACAVYAVVMVVTLLSGNSDAPWLPVPGEKAGKPAGQVDTTPLPTGAASPSATGGTAPRPTPPATGAAEQLPDTGAGTTGTAPATEGPATPADPAPTVTESAPAQSGGASAPGPAETTGDEVTASPDPTATDGGTADPTESAPGGGDSAGTGVDPGNLAQAPGTPTPLAAGAPAGPASDSPLVEYTL